MNGVKMNNEIIDSFRESLLESSKIFLESVKNKNFQEFKKFLRADLPFCAILPGGIKIDSLDEFLKQQNFWFEGETGTFNYKILNIMVLDNIGNVVSEVEYKNKASDGNGL